MPRAFSGDFRIAVLGYVVMRCALVVQWLRARRESGDPRGVCGRYALGISVVQVSWVLWLFAPPVMLWPGLVVLVLAEMVVPVYAEGRTGGSSWHPGHIAERYGLLVIIVCGEVILSTMTSFQAAVEEGFSAELVMVGVGALLIVLSIWWFYFRYDSSGDIATRGAWGWAYAHWLVLMSVAAAGAGIGVMVDLAQQEARLSLFGADLTLSVAVAVYLLTLGYVHHVVGHNPTGVAVSAASAVLVLGIGLWGRSPGVTTLALGVALVAVLGVVLRRDAVAARKGRAGEG